MVVILGPFPMAGILAAARITPITLLLTHFQAFLAPESIDPLEIDKPALFTEFDGDPTVAIPRMLYMQLEYISDQWPVFIRLLGLVSLCTTALA